jgi:hypothetical protein
LSLGTHIHTLTRFLPARHRLPRKYSPRRIL